MYIICISYVYHRHIAMRTSGANRSGGWWMWLVRPNERLAAAIPSMRPDMGRAIGEAQKKLVIFRIFKITDQKTPIEMTSRDETSSMTLIHFVHVSASLSSAQHGWIFRECEDRDVVAMQRSSVGSHMHPHPSQYQYKVNTCHRSSRLLLGHQDLPSVEISCGSKGLKSSGPWKPWLKRWTFNCSSWTMCLRQGDEGMYTRKLAIWRFP